MCKSQVNTGIADMIRRLLLILLFVSQYNSLPHLVKLSREPRDLETNEEPTSVKSLIDSNKRKDCTGGIENDECQEESQLSPQVLTCLNSCANCVKQWRAGVYNGRSCANDCLQQTTDSPGSLDPDCNLVRYFSSKVLAQV